MHQKWAFGREFAIRDNVLQVESRLWSKKLDQVWIAQAALLPVQIGWGALFWFTGRLYGRRALDGVALALAIAIWLAVVIKGGQASLIHGDIWAVVFTTTAAFLGFNAVLALAAIIRHRLTASLRSNSLDHGA